MATPEEILAVRTELGDTDPSLPVLSDDEVGYFIDKNVGNLNRATIDTAKTLMFKLSFRTDQTVDILSVKGSKVASNWIAALRLFISSPSLNPLYNNLNGWVGNTSRAEMQANIDNPDNYVTNLAIPEYRITEVTPENPFSI